MDRHQDLNKLIKLIEPNLALEKNLRFQHPQAEYLGKEILKMRAQIRDLAKDLNRSINNEGQVFEYLKDLIGFQEIIRRLGPVRETRSLMNIVLQLSTEVMGSHGSLLFLWGSRPLNWLKKRTYKVSAELELAIEMDLKRKSILDGHETEPTAIPYFIPGATTEGTLILVPLVSGKRQLGVFISYVATSHLNFFGHHLNIFDMFGQLVTIALENSVLYEKVQQLSVRDDLTNLYNARYLRAFLERELARASEDQPLALFFMDLDNFKQVNDFHGHLTGSQVLTEAAQLIHQFGMDQHCSCRYGGDEFVLALINTNLQKAKEIAEQIRFAIEINDFNKDGGNRLNLTISIGLAIYPHQSESAEDLINKADLAMYESKTKGKNQLTVWETTTTG